MATANNRKRRHPTSSTNSNDNDGASSSSSSVGWDPDGDDENDSHDINSNDDMRNSGHDHSQSSSFPSQIDVAIPTTPVGGGGVDVDIMHSDGSPANNGNEMIDSYSNSSSNSDDDDDDDDDELSHEELFHHIQPPERIRYQMLGAPTLLYRHAPSYRSPANRPSTLTPQQLFMALYTKDHPVQMWFNTKALKQIKQTQSALLTSTHIPCPSRPWGGPTKPRKSFAFNVYRSEMTKMRKEAGLPRFTMKEVAALWKDSTEEEKARYQQMSDERNATRFDTVAAAGEEGIEDNEEEQGNDDVARRSRNKSRLEKQRMISSYNVYVSEMITMCKEAGFPPFTLEEIAAQWKEITEEEKCIYHQMADEQNETIFNKDASAEEVGLEEQGNDVARRSRRKPKDSEEGTTKQRKISAYDVYVIEMTTMCKEAGYPPVTFKEIAALWKEMTEEVKARYQQMANERNAIKFGIARVPKKENSISQQWSGESLDDEAPVISSDTTVNPSSGAVDGEMEDVVNASVDQANCPTNFGELCARWRDMTEEGKDRYQQMNGTMASEERPTTTKKKKKKKNTAYNVYVSEMTTMCKGAGFPPCTVKEIAALWKEMTEEVVARYQQMADERDAIKLSCARHVPEKEDIATEQLRGGGLRDEAPVISSDTGEMEMMKQSLTIESIANVPQLPPYNVEDVNGIDTSLDPSIPDKPMSQVAPNEVGGPSGYGNCLLTIPCQCQKCNFRPPSWFLVHPTGDDLSSVSISKLSLPRGSSRHVAHAAANVDVGGRLLQISQCGPRLKSTDGIICLVARTSQHCSVIYAHAKFLTSVEKKVCSTNYVLQEKTRIDMSRTLQSPHLPAFIACDPKTTVSYFTCPSFAILSRDDPGQCTTIHRVVVRDEPVVQVHSPPSLSDISLLEFCSDDRMSLWAAARSIAIPKLSHGFFPRTFAAGYGHSLHRVDLRDDSSSFIWSPSHAEYLPDGLHSINGIMADANNDHLVWVSSTSAAKIWMLDVRHRPARIVVSWSLPSLCDDIGSHCPVSGIYGSGVIFSQPASICSSSKINGDVESCPDVPPVMFSVKKDPTTTVLGVHQFPYEMPRFQAKVIESAGFQDFQNSSIARSLGLGLPDVSESIFNIGIATFRCSSLTCLNEKQLEQLGYQKRPAHIMYVITMTSLGDMYCHSLLETNGEEESLAMQCPGLPVGTKAIPFPGKLNKSNVSPGHLNITLSDRFPIPSSAITPQVILNSDECFPFESYNIGDILNREPIPDIRLPEPDDTDEASEHKVPRSMYDLRYSNESSQTGFGNHGKTFRVASLGANDRDMGASKVHHSVARFAVILPNALGNHTSPDRGNNYVENEERRRPISLDPSHLEVATCTEKVEDGYDSNGDCSNISLNETSVKRPNEEINLDFIKELKDGYHVKDHAVDVEVGSVESGSSSDGE